MTSAIPRLVLAFAVVGVAVPTSGVAAAQACAGSVVGRLDRLHAPRGGDPRQLVPLGSPCALLAVRADGSVLRSPSGSSWSPVTVPPVSRVWADARTGTVVAGLASGGVAVSRDDGRSFAVSPDVRGQAVAATVSRGASPVVLVAAAPVAGAPVTALWRSSGGAFSPAGTVAAEPAAMAFDAWAADTVWLAAPSGPAAGLWVSSDAGTTWRQASAAPAYDVDVARRAASGLVVVARSDGLWRTTDAGATWARTPAPALTAARVDSGGPAALAVAGGVPVRVGPDARPARGPAVTALAAGLPRGCLASGLAADAALPTTFVLRCGAGWYAMVSAAAPDAADGGLAGPGGVGNGSAVRPLTLLRQLPVPDSDGTLSGSLAYDGLALYYAGEFRPAHSRTAPLDRVHLMSPHDGRDLGALDPGVAPKFLSYDASRDRLYVDDGRAMWRVDGRGGRARAAFPATFSFQWSWDAVTRTFVGVYEGDTTKSLLLLDEHGVVTGRCSLAAAIGVSTPWGYPSAVVAAADGAYVVLEDDATVLRVRRDCTLQATYLARRFSESPLENDGMVCDPLTFAPRTALWIRDSAARTVTAYDLPDGYCPLVTRLSVSLPRVLRDGDRANVCATLRRAGRGEPVAGQAVTLDADGVLLAAPPTDAAGRTCVVVRARGARPVAPARVRARFAGTAQWTPAAATAAGAVLPRVVAPLPRVPLPPLVAGGVAAEPVPPRPVPPAPPQPPADIAPIPHPQPHPNAQHNPGHQPGAQPGLLPDPEEEPDVLLADAGYETYAMSSRATTAPLLLGAALLTAAAACVARHQNTFRPEPVSPGGRRPRRPTRRGHAARRGR